MDAHDKTRPGTGGPERQATRNGLPVSPFDVSRETPERLLSAMVAVTTGPDAVEILTPAQQRVNRETVARTVVAVV